MTVSDELSNSPVIELSESYKNRFGGVARLYGESSLVALAQAHFVLIGLGGVGTWAAEAIARTGVGEITLIDMDDICVTNSNRQIHALASTIGQSKTKTLAARLKDINPEIIVHQIEDFLELENLQELIQDNHDLVVDVADAAYIKAALVAYCSAIKKPMVTAGSAGGKIDPRLVTSSDLAKTVSDPLLARVRQLLYRKYKFARDKKRKFHVDAVYSTEQMIFPQPDGEVCQQKSATQDGVKLDCANGFGSATMVTGTFGFVLAARAIDKYLAKYKQRTQSKK